MKIGNRAGDAVMPGEMRQVSYIGLRGPRAERSSRLRQVHHTRILWAGSSSVSGEFLNLMWFSQPRSGAQLR